MCDSLLRGGWVDRRGPMDDRSIVDRPINVCNQHLLIKLLSSIADADATVAADRSTAFIVVVAVKRIDLEL